jgi:hypothetical protein
MKTTTEVALFLVGLACLGPAATASEILSGDGWGTVTLQPPGGPETTGKVHLVGSLALDVLPEAGRSLLRLQFVVPDGSGVAFAVLELPAGDLQAEFNLDSPGITLLYYEQRPDGTHQKLFVGDEWAGNVRVLQGTAADPGLAQIDLSVGVTDWGQDGVPGTGDELGRVVSGTTLALRPREPIPALTYQAGGSVYVVDETAWYYEDGCTGSPDDEYYDDNTYDDSGYDDGSSCEGDTTDDSDVSDSSGDASCDGGDSTDGGWGDDSDDGSTDDSEGGSTGDSDDDSDWEGDTFDQLRAMGLATRAREVWHAARKPLRMAPLLLAVGLLLGLKRLTRRES